jgi:hypothetical protein
LLALTTGGSLGGIGLREKVNIHRTVVIWKAGAVERAFAETSHTVKLAPIVGMRDLLQIRRTEAQSGKTIDSHCSRLRFIDVIKVLLFSRVLALITVLLRNHD